jgi:hypothetical protein
MKNTQFFKNCLPYTHELKSGYAKNGLLKTVTYPTGGTLTYSYEQNAQKRSSFLIGNQLIGGVSVDKTILYDDGDHTKDIITEYSYKRPDGFLSAKWGAEGSDYTTLSASIYDEVWDQKKYKYPGIEYPEASVDVQKPHFWKNLIIGTIVGFAIKEAISLIVATSWIPVVNVLMIVYQIVNFIQKEMETYMSHRFILSNQNNMLSNPLGTYNARVEVRTNSPNGYNGKTVMDFTDNNDYPLIDGSSLEWPYVQSQRLLSWAYGLPKKVTVYDKNDNKVSEKFNDYQVYKEKIADQNNVNCKCATRVTISMGSDFWQNTMGHNFSWTQYESLLPRSYFFIYRTYGSICNPGK